MKIFKYRLSFYLYKLFRLRVPVNIKQTGKSISGISSTTFMNYVPHESNIMIDWDKKTIEILKN